MLALATKQKKGQEKEDGGRRKKKSRDSGGGGSSGTLPSPVEMTPFPRVLTRFHYANPSSDVMRDEEGVAMHKRVKVNELMMRQW